MTSDLALITLRRGNSNTQLPWSLAAPATRLRFGLCAPRKLQKISNTLVRIIKLRIHRFRNNDFLQPVDIFTSNERLLTPETREIKSGCTNTPCARMRRSVKINHHFISKKLSRIDNLVLLLTRHTLFDLNRRFD